LSKESCIIPFRNGAFSLVIFAICSVSFVVSIGALAAVKPKIPVDIREAKHVPAELMSYTLPYVVSFMSLDYHETGKFVGLLIFLSWMFVITYRSGQLILNPLFSVLGWRLYEIKYVFPGSENEYVGRVLSRSLLEPGRRYPHSAIQDILIIKPNNKDGVDGNTARP
jgi:hypothetical protein